MTQPDGSGARGGRGVDEGAHDSGRVADDAGEPALTVAAVARRLGVAPATLRTWDRRYGLGPSGHTTGRHRRYGPGDIARLELMQQALLRGASPAEAARYALTAPASTFRRDGSSRRPAPLAADPPQPATGGALDLTELGAAPGASLLASGLGAAPLGWKAASVDGTAAGDFPPSAGGTFRSGGRGLRMPGVSRLARGLGRAVLAMDAVGVHQLLGDAIAADGVVATWDEVVRPVLCAVAERWEHSGAGVEFEHLLSECLLTVLGRVVAVAPPPVNPRPVLLACVPDDQHCLPLRVLAAVLAERRVGSQLLGPALPAAALAAAVRRTAPAAVFLWAALPRCADASLLAGLPRTRQRVRLFVGGPGWGSVQLPSRVEVLDALGAAAERVVLAVLGEPAR
jgi:MerR family transcriptional regulator, light-induced transcriptional regulator